MYDNLVIKKKEINILGNARQWIRGLRIHKGYNATPNRNSSLIGHTQHFMLQMQWWTGWHSPQKPQIARSPFPHSPSILHAAPCDTLLFHDVSLIFTNIPLLPPAHLFRVTCQPCTCWMVFSSLSLKCGICNFAFPRCLAQQSCADSLTALSHRWYHCKKNFHPLQNRMLNRMKCRGVWSREQVFCSYWERNQSQSGGKAEVSKTPNLFLWYVL